MAGLRCAEVLINHGIKVTILEGRNRTGGRVHQSTHLGHLVDVGPNWIHGTDHNPILDLAAETNTTTHSIGERQSIFDLLGRIMNEKKATEYSELVWGIVADAFKHSNNDSAGIPPDRSLQDFFREKVKEKAVSEDEQKILLQMAQMWGAFVGDPIDKQSLKFFWLEECIEGENLFVASTYKAILDRVAKTARASADIQFSKTVTSIESLSSLTDTENPKTLLRTACGSTQIFDEVVITAPLGWLKRNKSAFVPPLPARISQAIDNISYGRLEKVYITFPSAFWDEPLSNQKQQTETPKDAGTEDTHHYPGFTHFLSPQYAPTTNPKNWNQELVNLAALPSSCAHPTLLFYIYGPCSTHITSLIANLDPDSPAYLTALAEFFHPYYSLLPNYTPTDPSCSPKKCLATSWSTDPLAGYGSYSNFQISPPNAKDAVELDKDIEALRTGLPERGVWLAGEHTAPFVALGTVTGAWWSGEGVGRRIVSAYGGGGETASSETEGVGEVETKAFIRKDGKSVAGPLNAVDS
ncbi:MAG: hypothetical protein M1830_002993 [Pleopsidium flavum]|nr:MAG: hypothetical protein M1830_002993 [Pleopsidium flavum]